MYKCLDRKRHLVPRKSSFAHSVRNRMRVSLPNFYDLPHFVCSSLPLLLIGKCMLNTTMPRKEVQIKCDCQIEDHFSIRNTSFSGPPSGQWSCVVASRNNDALSEVKVSKPEIRWKQSRAKQEVIFPTLGVVFRSYMNRTLTELGK